MRRLPLVQAGSHAVLGEDEAVPCYIRRLVAMSAIRDCMEEAFLEGSSDNLKPFHEHSI